MSVNKKRFNKNSTKLTNIIRTPFFGNSKGGDLFEAKESLCERNNEARFYLTKLTNIIRTPFFGSKDGDLFEMKERTSSGFLKPEAVPSEGIKRFYGIIEYKFKVGKNKKNTKKHAYWFNDMVKSKIRKTTFQEVA